MNAPFVLTFFFFCWASFISFFEYPCADTSAVVLKEGKVMLLKKKIQISYFVIYLICFRENRIICQLYCDKVEF